MNIALVVTPSTLDLMGVPCVAFTSAMLAPI